MKSLTVKREKSSNNQEKHSTPLNVKAIQKNNTATSSIASSNTNSKSHLVIFIFSAIFFITALLFFIYVQFFL